MKRDDITSSKTFRTHQSFSPDEILAVGGTTAFGFKAGKNNETLIAALENCPKPEPFTNEEWNSLIMQLEKDK